MLWGGRNQEGAQEQEGWESRSWPQTEGVMLMMMEVVRIGKKGSCCCQRSAEKGLCGT